MTDGADFGWREQYRSNLGTRPSDVRMDKWKSGMPAPIVHSYSGFCFSAAEVPLREQAVMLERISDAVADTVPLVREKIAELPEFRDIGKRMLLAWQEGTTSLRDRRVYAAGDWPADKVFEGISDPPKLEKPRTVLGRSPLLGSRSSRSKK